MSVRLRRLEADYNQICTLFSGKGKIKLLKTIGIPPEKYQFELCINGLEKDFETGQIKYRNNFIVEIVLTSAYPRMAPQCKMLTPVFHPNIAPHAICIGDHWSAGESISNMLIRIAEMITCQSYNLQSPLNGEAAKWVDENLEQLPVDTFDFSSLLHVGEVSGIEMNHQVNCANCGKLHNNETINFYTCMNQHICCEDCAFKCSCCESILCLKCASFKCQACQKTVCHKCIHKCKACSALVCLDHKVKCHICELEFCNDCIINCSKCQGPTCINDIHNVEYENGKFYICSQCKQEDFSE